MKWRLTLYLLIQSIVLFGQYDLKPIELSQCVSTVPTEYTIYDDPNSYPSYQSLTDDFFREYTEYDSRYWTISQYIYPTSTDAFEGTNPYTRDRIARSVTFEINNPAIFYLRIVENVTDNPRIIIVKYAIKFSRRPTGRNDFEIIGCQSGDLATYDLNKTLYDLYGQNYMYVFSYYNTYQDAMMNANPIPESEWSSYSTERSQTNVFLKIVFNEQYGNPDCFTILPLKLKLPTYDTYIDENNLLFCGVPYQLDGPYDPNNVYQFSNYEWYYNGELKATTKDVLIDSVGDWKVFFNVNNGCRESMLITIREEHGTGYIKNVRSTMNQVIIEAMNPEQIIAFSSDGLQWQTSNVFNSTEELQFTFYIKNTIGCVFGPYTYDISNFFNFFSPNGDGINDYWDIRTDLKQTDAIISIYDRFGKLITTGRINEILPWNGKHNNQPLAVGSYWFKILLNNEVVKEGNILLKTN